MDGREACKNDSTSSAAASQVPIDQLVQLECTYVHYELFANRSRDVVVDDRLMSVYERQAPPYNVNCTTERCRNKLDFVSVCALGVKIAPFSLTSAPYSLHFKCFEAVFAQLLYILSVYGALLKKLQVQK